MFNKNKKIYISFIFLFVFLFSGCSLRETLKNLDNAVGEQMLENGINASIPEKDVTEELDDIALEDLTYKDLTKEHKQKIEEWLKKNGYNRYGDSAGVIYTGGTPLFNETSGATQDRFEYILQKQPDILQELFE